ncbi:hypothetical protein SMA679_1011 [Streptococcus macedonicus]|nr:hypothetical protein SMA679_1011 [Streptococcus macedonicus]
MSKPYFTTCLSESQPYFRKKFKKMNIKNPRFSKRGKS